MRKYNCPINIFLISSNCIKNFNTHHIEIGEDVFGTYHRLYLVFDLNELPKNINIKKTVLDIPCISPINNCYGSLQGFEVINKEEFFDSNVYGKCIFKQRYYKNENIKIDLTSLITNYISKDIMQGGLLLTTDEKKFEKALIKDEGIQLLIYSEECSNSHECDKCEKCDNNHCKSIFYEDIIKVNSNQNIYQSKPICVSELELYTIFFKNKGTSDVELTIENSTNGTDYLKTEEVIKVEPSGYEGITAYLFSKYVRAVIRSQNNPICGEITIQGQFRK